MRPTGKRASLPSTGSEGMGPMSMTYLALRRSSLPMVSLVLSRAVAVMQFYAAMHNPWAQGIKNHYEERPRNGFESPTTRRCCCCVAAHRPRARVGTGQVAHE